MNHITSGLQRCYYVPIRDIIQIRDIIVPFFASLPRVWDDREVYTMYERERQRETERHGRQKVYKQMYKSVWTRARTLTHLHAQVLGLQMEAGAEGWAGRARILKCARSVV